MSNNIKKTTKEQFIREACDNLADLLVSKGAAYGNSFSKLWEKRGMYVADIEISKKLYRIENMLENGMKSILNESIVDSWMDIAGTAILSMYETSKINLTEECAEKPKNEYEDIVTKEVANMLERVGTSKFDFKPHFLYVNEDHLDYDEIIRRLDRVKPNKMCIYKVMPKTDNGKVDEGFRFGHCTGDIDMVIAKKDCIRIRFVNVTHVKTGNIIQDGVMSVDYNAEQMEILLSNNHL